MPDDFTGHTNGLTSPPTRAFSVVPSDNVDLAHVTRCLNVATSGFVAVRTLGGDVVTLYVAAGGVFPIRADRVLTTGTDATGIVALY